jgi:hypothetical protein
MKISFFMLSSCLLLKIYNKRCHLCFKKETILSLYEVPAESALFKFKNFQTILFYRTRFRKKVELDFGKKRNNKIFQLIYNLFLFLLLFLPQKIDFLIYNFFNLLSISSCYLFQLLHTRTLQ